MMAISKLRPSLPQGDSLGGRKIVQVLGEGGFGITYKVLHEHLKSYFAIKELFPRGCIRDTQKQVIPAPEAPEYTEGSLSNDEFTASRLNFLNEGRSLAQLKFPGIVEVVDLLEANNTAYLVMELVSGRHLGDVVTPAAEPHFAGESPQASADALSIFDAFEIIEAIRHPLEHVHQKKTIHRDIKPSNIMWDSQKKRATLIDFGGARDFLRNHHLMRDGLYSYGYTALEQYELRATRDPKQDDPNQLDAATDIYGLAATLFYLLTGHIPSDARARKSGDTLLRQFSKLRQDVPAPFVDALFTGLALYKRDRPRSVTLFLSELERGLASRSRPTSMDVIQRVREESQVQERREVAVKAAVVLALVLVILAGFAAMFNFMQGNVFRLGDQQFSRGGVDSLSQPPQIEHAADPQQAEPRGVPGTEDVFGSPTPEPALVKTTPEPESPPIPLRLQSTSEFREELVGAYSAMDALYSAKDEEYFSYLSDPFEQVQSGRTLPRDRYKSQVLSSWEDETVSVSLHTEVRSEAQRMDDSNDVMQVRVVRTLVTTQQSGHIQTLTFQARERWRRYDNTWRCGRSVIESVAEG